MKLSDYCEVPKGLEDREVTSDDVKMIAEELAKIAVKSSFEAKTIGAYSAEKMKELIEAVERRM